MKNILFFMLALVGLAHPLIVLASPPSTLNFLTSQDLTSDHSESGIRLKSNKTTDATVYGLYIRELAYVTPGSGCNTATTIYNSSTNKAVGAVVTPVTIKAGKGANVGSNYLYNMLMQAFYYVGIIIPSSPPGCALPGCSWGSDTTLYNWCIYLGALSPVTTGGAYTASVPPSTELASSGPYDYNLITSYIMLGPISCDDETLSCHIADTQTQTFN